MKKGTLLDIIVFIFLLMLTAVFPWFVRNTWFNNPVIWSFILAFPTAIYFGIRKKKNWKKIIVGSLVFGALFGVILEYIAHVNLAWQVPTTIFPFRILGANTIDALIGYIPMTLFILVFYEHFFDKSTHRRVSPHVWYAVIPALFVAVLFTILHFISPASLLFSHPYIKLGIAAIIPMIFQLIKFPNLFSKYARLSVSLFGVFFIFELVGITFNYWIFPGNDYIGMVTTFGRTFPLEEIIFWMLLYPPTIAAYYEEFIDDGK